MRRLAAAIVCMVAIGATSTAQAAQRYAAPAGTGETCSRQLPCSLETAVGKAKSNDEVIVTAGTYELTAGAATGPLTENVDIHGDEGGPMPAISGPNPFETLLQGEGSRDRLAYVHLFPTAKQTGARCFQDGSVERVIVTGGGESVVGIQANSECTVRDSLVHVEGTPSVAVEAFSIAGTSTAPLRNVTAIATGPGAIAVRAAMGFGFPGSETADLRNVIAHGDGADLNASTSILGTGKIIVANSDFATVKLEGSEATITDAGGNQKAPPVFVNPIAGDYREAPGSPTIDAGVADPLDGPFDLVGNPRTLGSAPDIGAYEFVPPAVAPAQIQSLAIAPKTFRAARAGGAIASGKKAGHAPIGARVIYSLSGKANAEFTVERKSTGRRVKGKCVKKSRGNAAKKKCAILRPVKPIFAQAGQAGPNSFKFSGRLGNKPLKPGSYLLLGSAGGAVKRASFRIVK